MRVLSVARGLLPPVVVALGALIALAGVVSAVTGQPAAYRLTQAGALIASLGFLGSGPGNGGVTGWVERHSRRVLTAVATLIACLFVGFKLRQHAHFETTAFDLSLYAGTLAETLRGNGLMAPLLGRSLLSEHFSPILLAWALPLVIVRSEVTLLVAHALTLWAGGVALVVFARDLRLPAWSAGLLGVIYWLNPSVWKALAFDVHPEVFYPLLVTLLAMSLARRDRRAALVFLALTLCIKEDAGLVVAGLCLTLWFALPATRRLVGATAFAAVVTVALVVKLVIPWLEGTTGQSHFLVERYGHLGSTYAEVAVRLLTSPALLAELVAGRPTRELLAGVGLVPLATPAVIVGVLPELLLNRATNYPAQATLTLYYALPCATVLFSAAPLALSRLERSPRLTALMLLTAFLPLTATAPPFAFSQVTQGDRDFAEALRAIEASGHSVLAHNRFHPHLLGNPKLELFRGRGDAAWLVLDVNRDDAFSTVDEAREAVARATKAGYREVLSNETGIILHRE